MSSKSLQTAVYAHIGVTKTRKCANRKRLQQWTRFLCCFKCCCFASTLSWICWIAEFVNSMSLVHILQRMVKMLNTVYCFNFCLLHYVALYSIIYVFLEFNNRSTNVNQFVINISVFLDAVKVSIM